MSSVEPDEVEAPAESPETPADDPYRAILDALATELGDALVESHPQRDDLWIRVRADAWRRTAEVLRHQLGYDYFSYLSGVDWLPHTWPNPKVVEGDGDEEAEAEEPEPSSEIETGYAGGDSRFQVLARVYSTARHNGITLKADLDDQAPRVESWREVYAGADWHERETWEMYGFDFVGHPNLVHIYLPSEFEGFPLRKDFPLLAREVKPWPGLVDVEGFPAGYGDEDTSDPAAVPAEDAG
ncbi:MAG: NADH-quinone oxidoreductase subunit C [Acidimicrobiales bacterium]